jgi:hypothetical protein
VIVIENGALAGILALRDMLIYLALRVELKGKEEPGGRQTDGVQSHGRR